MKSNVFYLLWFAKDITKLKYRQLFMEQDLQDFTDGAGSHLWFDYGVEW